MKVRKNLVAHQLFSCGSMRALLSMPSPRQCSRQRGWRGCHIGSFGIIRKSEKIQQNSSPWSPWTGIPNSVHVFVKVCAAFRVGMMGAAATCTGGMIGGIGSGTCNWGQKGVRNIAVMNIFDDEGFWCGRTRLILGVYCTYRADGAAAGFILALFNFYGESSRGGGALAVSAAPVANQPVYFKPGSLR